MAAIINSEGICEVHFLHNGEICRKIAIIKQGREYVVSEQEVNEDLITKVISWSTKFLLAFPNRQLARTCYLGLTSLATYEEGNSTNDITDPSPMRQSLDKGIGISRPHPSGI